MAEETDTIDPLFKLRNSPLEGVEAYRSPFYRRLLSAGYKGYVQGSVGGATLLGGMGAALGGVFAGALALTGLATGGAALFAIPAFAFLGIKYGKETFGNIGALAAISAEQAELSEKRRSLLDRYFETPSKEEAKEIESLLKNQGEERKPQHWFHWKTGLFGAALLGLIAFSCALIAPEILVGQLGHFGLTLTTTTITPAIIAGVTAVAALAGSVIGIDRAYIRKWFDAQEHLHDEQDSKVRKGAHHQEVERLQQAYRREGFGFESRGLPHETLSREAIARVTPISPRTVAQPEPPPGNSLDTALNTATPSPVINARDAEYQQRAVNLSAPVASL